MIVIDGSMGEGGGQLLRSSLALSMVTGLPFKMERIRAKRSKPGLMRQHLTCVEAAAKVCGAKVQGAEIGSMTLVFEPGEVVPGEYDFAVGTAGSTSLVLQTVLPALMLASKRSMVTCRGGTHNPMSPTSDFLAQSFLPLLERMGPKLALTLERYGFFPAGGGEVHLEVDPVTKLEPLLLHEAGVELSRRAVVMSANLPGRIAQRELELLKEGLAWPESAYEALSVRSNGPGNLVCAAVEYEKVTAMFVAFGERSKSSEQVVQEVVDGYRSFLSAQVPVEEFLVDQLLLPMALSGGGSIRCVAPSRHANTNMELIEKFVEVEFVKERLEGRAWQIDVEA